MKLGHRVPEAPAHEVEGITMKHELIESILVSEGLVDLPGLVRAQKVQHRDGGSLGKILDDLGLAQEAEVATTIAKALQLDRPEAGAIDVDKVTAALLPPDFCRRRLVVPIGVEGRSLRLAVANPLDFSTIQDVEFRTGMPVTEVVVSETEIVALLAQLHPSAGDEKKTYDLLASVNPEGEFEASETEHEVADIRKLAEDLRLPPIVRLVNMILSDAARLGASDIHIEPQEKHVQVRCRMDGLLHDVLKIPKGLQDSTVSRVKIISRMDIAERRKPQDGRSRLRFENRRIDLRVSSLPTQFGEKIVIRLLDTSVARLELGRMGFEAENRTRLEELLSRPQGVVLVTGPTGSGKTTTLYAALNWLKSPTKNIITVEEPIEFQIPGINQVQINKRAGMTFASGLRSILRQDPNIVLVGEIRDGETADIALEAAQTGHLVLSTVHTNDAPSTITRLFDLGIEPFLVASSMAGILAQRLVRQVCRGCAVDRAPTMETVDRVGGKERLPQPGTWKAGTGCEACRQSGFKGRLAIHEVLVITEEIRQMITCKTPDYAIREAARRLGMKTLMEDGIAKAARGLTTLDEVLRVAPPDVTREPAATSDRGGVAAGPGSARVAQKILVVEDSPTIVSVVQYFLELEGYEVLVAENGEDGLSIARAQRPDVVVTDLRMPGMDGLALVKALRADPSTRDAVIIILTSETAVESEERGFELGADDYIPKPIEPRRLIARIRALSGRTKAPAAAG